MTTTAAAKTTDLDESRSLLEDLGFEFVPVRLPELMEKSVREKHSLGKFLELVARTEREAREERRIKTSLRLSGLPLGKTLDAYDFAFQRAVDRGKIELLATSEFVRRKENVLFLGPPGVGKTHLATGLAVKAIQNGFSVSFTTADLLIDALRKDEAVSSRRFLRRKCAADHRRARLPGPRPPRFAPALQGDQLEIRARQHDYHLEQEHSGLA